MKTKLLVCLALLALTVPAFADTGLARHRKFYAVPATGKVTIDGKLDDWDLSGQVLMYVVSETADMQSAKFAMMYDKDALYVSGEVRDPSPMMNRHDPKVEGNWGWNADSCQFRITLDPKLGYPVNVGYGAGDANDRNIVHLTMWYYTDKQEPCLTAQASMKYQPVRDEWSPHGVVPHDAFEAKYVKAADGRGYTFEYRIPWSTLGAKAPLKGGDLVAGTVQFNWSQPDGLATNGGWAYDVMAGPGFPYQSAQCWGKIIFTDKGNLPKEIVEEGVAPAKPLPLKFTYDVPEDSQITIQLMDTNNMVRRILVPQGDRRAGQNVELWDGMNDQGKPLPPGTYTWKGIYHKPITQKFLFSPHNSGNPPYATDDGKGGWGADESNPTDAAAFDDGVLLAWGWGEAGWALLRVTFDGKKQWGAHIGAFFLATDGKRIFSASHEDESRTQGVSMRDIADARPLVFGNGKANLAAPPGGDVKNNAVTGLAVADGVIYVSYRDRNLVALFDVQSGDLKKTIEMPTPGRLAVAPSGTLCVVSGNTVQISNPKLQITNHLDSPTGIAVGPDGLIYVANAGKLQNIFVFDAAGKYLRSIGEEGGRPPVGKYDPNGLLEPAGMTLDKNGHLWVAEKLDGPRRHSEWDAKTGKFVAEYFGGCGYAGYSYIDPKHPNEIYCHNVLWKIDWKNNKCAPVSTTWRPTNPNSMWAMSEIWPVYFTAKNGKQYAYGGAGFMSTLSRREGDVYKPFAAVIAVDRKYDAYKGLLNILAMMEGRKPTPTQIAVMADEKKFPNGFWVWQDKNNDQTVQEDELSSLPANLKQSMFGLVDENLNMHIAGGLLRPVRIEPTGQAVYDFSKFEETPFTKTGRRVSCLDPNDGGIISYDIYTGSPEKNWLSKWSPDGKLLWAYPGMSEWKGDLDKPMQAPGRLYGMTTSLGVAGKLTGMSDYFGGYHIFTTDGVYVGMLMRDSRDGKGLGPDITASETFTGQLVKPDGMNRYFLLAGAADARVTEIFGFDSIRPLPGGTLTLSESDVKTASDALIAYNAKLAKSKRLSIAREKKGLANAVAVSKVFDANRNFTTRATYDADNLYVSFDVTSPSELVNSQPDPQTLFKGGNCLDIQIAADPSADPKRKTPAPGDVRILVTRKDGKPFAVVYRPKVKGFTGQPIVMTSPTGKESFDAIEVSDKIGLDYQKTPAGYTAVVTIPRAVSGLELKPGQQVTMDLGILYGNVAGNQCSARSYWMNNGFSANVTYDIPNESRLEPQEWGIATTE